MSDTNDWYLSEEVRCAIIDWGAFNDIITGYVALAFKAMEIESKVSACGVMSYVLDTYSAEEAIEEFKSEFDKYSVKLPVEAAGEET